MREIGLSSTTFKSLFQDLVCVGHIIMKDQRKFYLEMLYMNVDMDSKSSSTKDETTQWDYMLKEIGIIKFLISKCVDFKNLNEMCLLPYFCEFEIIVYIKSIMVNVNKQFKGCCCTCFVCKFIDYHVRYGNYKINHNEIGVNTINDEIFVTLIEFNAFHEECMITLKIIDMVHACSDETNAILREGEHVNAIDDEIIAKKVNILRSMHLMLRSLQP